MASRSIACDLCWVGEAATWVAKLVGPRGLVHGDHPKRASRLAEVFLRDLPPILECIEEGCRISASFGGEGIAFYLSDHMLRSDVDLSTLRSTDGFLFTPMANVISITFFGEPTDPIGLEFYDSECFRKTTTEFRAGGKIVYEGSENQVRTPIIAELQAECMHVNLTHDADFLDLARIANVRIADLDQRKVVNTDAVIKLELDWIEIGNPRGREKFNRWRHVLKPKERDTLIFRGCLANLLDRINEKEAFNIISTIFRSLSLQRRRR